MQKLEPLQAQMTSLSKAREWESGVGWGEHGIARPRTEGRCWAEVRIRGSSDYAPAFDQCRNKPREGFLTCRVHYERELSARELKCELEGLKMHDIAYADAAEKEQARQALFASLTAKLNAR